MAGAIRCGGCTLRDAFAVVGRHATESTLIYLAVFGARERHAEMFELVDRLRRIAAEIFDGILIAEPIRALDGVVHMPAPIILAHIAERGGDTALRRNGVAAGGKHLCNACRL